jgi:hypothetical protein
VTGFLQFRDPSLLCCDERAPLRDASLGFLQTNSKFQHRRSPIKAISNFAQKIVGKAQPMTIVVHKVEGQERKYSDNNSNGAHTVSMRS